MSSGVAAARRLGIGLVLPLALHVFLFAVVYQSGFTRQELYTLIRPGPYRLIEPYVAAAKRYGPLGVVRAYYFGESDDRLYLEYARLLLTGRADLDHVQKIQGTERDAGAQALPARAWPYRDVRVEYPPLAFLAFVPPALVSTDYAVYRRAFALWMLVLHLFNLALAYRLLAPAASAPAALGGEAEQRGLSWLAWASLLYCVLLGRVVAARMDHLAAGATLVCLWAGRRALAAEASRTRLRWALLTGLCGALGAMTKLVPALALVSVLVVGWQSGARDRVRLATGGALSALVALAAMNLALLAFAGDRYLDSFRYHTARGVQIESLYAGLLLAVRGFGNSLVASEGFGSTNLDSCFTPAIKLLSPWLFVALTALLALRRWTGPAGRALALLSAALLLGYVVTSRVLSPQYLIWPAAILLAAGAREAIAHGRAAAFSGEAFWRRLCALLLVVAALSQVIYPQGYPVLRAFHPLAIAILNLRNAALCVLLYVLVRGASRGRTTQRNT